MTLEKSFHVLDWDQMDPHTFYPIGKVSIWYWGILINIDAHVLKNSGGRLFDKIIIVDNPNEDIVELLQSALCLQGINIESEAIFSKAPIFFSLPHEAYENPFFSDSEEECEENFFTKISRIIKWFRFQK
jgi:hypothetical protein